MGPLEVSRPGATLFVLGSGPSICTLTEAQWDHVGHHDSLGINFSGAHHFVPTYLSQEHIRDDGHLAARQANRLAMLESFGDEGPIEIWKIAGDWRRLESDPAFLTAPERTGGAAHLSVGYQLAAHSEEAGRRVLRGVARRWRPLRWMSRLGFQPDLGSSVIWSLFQAHIAGYERVVLCGVDLTGSLHFWDHEPALLRSGVESPIPWRNRADKTHSLEAGSLRASVLIVALAEAFTSTGGPTISLGTTGSLLRDHLPPYQWATGGIG